MAALGNWLDHGSLQMNLHCVKSLIFSQSVGNTVWQSSSLKLEMLVRLNAMLFTFIKNFARVAKKHIFSM